MIYKNDFKKNKKDILVKNLSSFLNRKAKGHLRIRKEMRYRGQSSVEFALVLPFLFIIILVVSQLGYMVYLQNVLEHAAREGARALSVSDSNSIALERINEVCAKMKRELLNVELIPAMQNQRQMGGIVKVIIRYDYTGFASMASFLSGRKFPIESFCSMRMECSNE